MTNPFPEDLEHILSCLPAQSWSGLRNERILLTGGTGFFGCWLLESLLAANERFGLRTGATVVTRDAQAFGRKAPHLAHHPSIQLVQGNVRTFDFPAGEFRYAIHAATEASRSQIVSAPLEMFSTIVDGTRRVLEFARARGVQNLLLTSSGAVYGRQRDAQVAEDCPTAPDPIDPLSVYGEGKRAAEQLCSLYEAQFGIECKIARCFAFVGPHLPLDTHFAIGNFIRDAMGGGTVRVNGDGTPRRSYLYAADLAVWLWTILFKGRSCRPYNVGSEIDYSVAEVARAVVKIVNPLAAVGVARRPEGGAPAERYVPSTCRARQELGLAQSFDLAEAIRRTASWHQMQRSQRGERLTCA